MIRLGIAPRLVDFSRGAAQTIDQWFNQASARFNVASGAGDPTVASVPENQWIVYRNTSSGEVRIWTNIAGVLKKSAAFT